MELRVRGPAFVDRGSPEDANAAKAEDTDVGEGTSGCGGNEEADRRAKQEVEIGWRLQKQEVATPAGIRQAFPIHPRAIKGLVYLVTGKGP